MEILLVFVWILATLCTGMIAILLGARYAVVYPIALVAALSVMANVFAAKIVTVGPFVVPGGVLVFSAIFFLTDALSELWGKREAHRAVWAGFFANVVFALSVVILIAWPAADFAAREGERFAEVLSLAPRFVLAGLIAYLISQHHDIWAFHFWKEKTGGRYLWLRNNASTIVSQLIDSVIFVTIAFAGVAPLLPLILGQWAVKTLIAVFDTPFLYLARFLVGKMPRGRALDER